MGGSVGGCVGSSVGGCVGGSVGGCVGSGVEQFPNVMKMDASYSPPLATSTPSSVAKKYPSP